jgi:hypothetical protein
MYRGIFLVFIVSFFSTGILAQGNNTYPPPPSPDWAKDSVKPYQKHPVLPAFNVLLKDSSTIFNTYNIPAGRVTALVLFDPTCKHCKWSVEALTRAMDSVKDVQFYFVTSLHDMGTIRSFYDAYNMGKYSNIKVVGWDMEFFFLEHYRVMQLPDVALYDEKKKLIKLLEGEFTATTIYNAVREKKSK